MGRGNVFKPTIGNESLRQDINDNGVREENFVTSKNLVAKGKMSPHQNISKYTSTSPKEETNNQTDYILLERR